MNFCIFYGTIVTDINFDFIYKSKDISVSTFHIELSNNSIVEVRAYNELADFSYSKLNKGDRTIIKGKLYSNYILVEEFNNSFN